MEVEEAEEVEEAKEVKEVEEKTARLEEHWRVEKGALGAWGKKAVFVASRICEGLCFV